MVTNNTYTNRTIISTNRIGDGGVYGGLETAYVPHAKITHPYMLVAVRWIGGGSLRPGTGKRWRQQRFPVILTVSGPAV